MGRGDRKILRPRTALILLGGGAAVVALAALLWLGEAELPDVPRGFFAGTGNGGAELPAQLFEGVEIQGRSPDGVRWTLFADRAASDAQGRVGRLEGVRALFDSPEGAVETRSGSLGAEEGGLVRMEDGVTVRWNDFDADMRWADLDVARRRLATDAPVEVRGQGVVVRGQGMELDMNTRTARVLGGVRATMEGSGP